MAQISQALEFAHELVLAICPSVPQPVHLWTCGGFLAGNGCGLVQSKQLPETGLDRAQLAGLIKLLKDGCENQEADPSQAERIRAVVFGAASNKRRALGIGDAFERAAVLAECSESLQMTAEAIDAALFADLPSAQIVERLRPQSAHALLQRYNLALAQGLLLRATRVVVELQPCSAPRLREIFRRIKFHRLMIEVRGDAEHGYEFVLDGPLKSVRGHTALRAAAGDVLAHARRG